MTLPIQKFFSLTFKDLKLTEPLLMALENINIKSNANPGNKPYYPYLMAETFSVAHKQEPENRSFSLYYSVYQTDLNQRDVKALILAPTRELALQISGNIHTYSKHLKLSHATIFGGVPQKNQEKYCVMVWISLSRLRQTIGSSEPGHTPAQQSRTFCSGRNRPNAGYGFYTTSEK